MKDYIENAILLAESGDQFSEDWFKAISAFSSGLETRGTSSLKAFSVDSGKSGDFELVPHNSSIPRFAEVLATDAWHWTNHTDVNERSLEIIRVAREGFTRASFHSLILRLALAARPESLSIKPDWIKSIKKRLVETDWSDADAVVRLPMADKWSYESEAAKFIDWVAENSSTILCRNSGGPKISLLAEYPPKREELSAALALTWIDEALVSPHLIFLLMAEAAQAMRDVGFFQAVDEMESGGDDDSLSVHSRNLFSRRGADARHRKSREAKASVLTEFAKGNFPTKDKAAEAFANKLVPYGFSTIRNWLRNA